MIYRSNLEAPDLHPHFKHSVSRVLGHSFGHDVISDWADKPEGDPTFGLYQKCGFWTHDEAAILYNIAKMRPGLWLDIGAHTGWTMAHMIAAGVEVVGIEPMTRLEEWQRRLEANLSALWSGVDEISYLRSNEYLATCTRVFDGVVIDGDHEQPWPLSDAINANAHTRHDSRILFHDAMGAPVWRGMYWLIDQGYKCHVYFTPHIVACCYRGDAFTPPMHVPDPAIPWAEIKTNHMRGFDWGRVSHDAI